MISATRDLSGMLWRRSGGEATHQARHPDFPAAVVAFLSLASRLDNAEELRSVLRLPRDAGCEQILLQGWHKWGSELPDRLRGAFAFAIFEPRQRRLFLARDISGMAPLYYIATRDQVAVADTSRMVRGIFGQALDLDRNFHAAFLSGIFASREDSFFTGLQRLPAAHIAEFRAEADGELRSYWSAGTVEREERADDAAERFRALFDRAAARRYQPGNTALLLSGGLDSSAILGSLTANGVEPRELPCMVETYRKTAGWNDEAYLSSLQRRFRLTFHEVPGDLHDPLCDMEEWLQVLDGPYVSYGHSGASNMLKVAATQGWTNLLSGHGGDEVVGYGAGRLNELARSRRWLRLWRETAGVAALSGKSRIRFMRRYLTHNPKYRRIELRILHHFPDPQQSEEPSLSDEMMAMLDPDQLTPRRVDTRSDHDEHMVHVEALENPIQQLALETIGQCSRATGVETEMPFYDRDLIEYSLSLPSDWKLRNGMTRYVMREAMRDRLPRDVLARQTKYDFTRPFLAGLCANREAVLDWTAPKPGLLADMVNEGRLARVREDVVRKGTGIDTDDARFVWRCTIMAMWQAQIERTPASPQLVPLMGMA